MSKKIEDSPLDCGHLVDKLEKHGVLWVLTTSINGKKRTCLSCAVAEKGNNA
jgi:hypothetical protein